MTLKTVEIWLFTTYFIHSIIYIEQFPKQSNKPLTERILVTNTGAAKIPIRFLLKGDVENTEPTLLLALLQALPEIRSYGAGCLSLANVNFQGHVAVTEKRLEKEVLFELDGTVDNRRYQGSILISQAFFTFDAERKLSYLDKVVNQSKLTLLRILNRTPIEVINQN